MKCTVLFFTCFAAVAFAENAPPPGQGVSMFVPLILMFGIFYFLIIRPQHKKQKTHQQFLANLKRGDMVITNAGIVGVVKNLSDKLVTLEVDDGVCLKTLRSQVMENAETLKEKDKDKKDKK